MNTPVEMQKTQRSLRAQGILMIILLAVQYILGMINNFFVDFPQSDQPEVMWRYAASQASEISHIFLGLLLFVSAAILVVRAVRAKNRSWIIASITGLAGILSAIVGGVTFIPSQNDQLSFVMAVAFIVALLAYSWGVYASRK